MLNKYIILAVKIVAVVAILIFVSGCSLEETNNEKLRDLEFTVVENEDLPEELLNIIEEKKTGEFKVTYTDKENLYICIGYGEQTTGGYSISVNECYLSANAIYVDANLLGPSKEEQISDALSYPYIVIKTEFIDKSVVFE